MMAKRFTIVCLLSILILQSIAQVLAVSDASNSAQVIPSPTPTVLAPASPIRLTVSPPSLFLDTKPGESGQTSLKVLNAGDETELLEIHLMTFTAQANGSSPALSEFAAGDEAQHWLKITPSQFSLEPQKWQTLNVDFSPPDSAGLSYYYAIVIRRASATHATEGESTVIGAPAVLLLTKVIVPYEKQELQLVSFSTSKKVYEYLPAEFSIEIKNTGNVHLAPVGNIFIDDAKKRDAGMIELNRTLGVVLPNSVRTYHLDWNDGFPRYEAESIDGSLVKDEQGKPKKKVKWDFSQADKFRFGKYNAHLIFIYDDGERDVPTEAVVSFWVIPWKILGVIAVIVLLALLGLFMPIFLLLKRKRKRTK